MARQVDQKMRFNDIELALMKSLFSENEDLIFLIRKVLLGFDVTKGERENLNKVMSAPVVKMIRKVFLPEIDFDSPLFQLTDMVNGLSSEMKAGKMIDEMFLQIAAKDIEVDYLNQQLSILSGKKVKETITLDGLAVIKGKEKEQSYIDIIARTYLLSYIDSNLQQVKFLAGKKEESVEETVERLKKNSSQ